MDVNIKSKKGYSSERTSEEYLEVNSCGIEHIYARDRGSERPNGRSDYHIIYVQKGVCNLLLDGEWRRVYEGGVIMFRPNEPQIYKYFGADNSVSHYVHFTGVGCERLLKRLGIDGVRVFDMGRSASFEELSEKLVCEFSMRKPLYMDCASAYLYQMLNTVARKHALRQGSINQKSESRINAACKRIYDNIQEPPSVQSLAAESCLSVSRFLHLFCEVMGKSVTEFVTAVRVERAKEMLIATDMSVRDIAEAVGYEDQNYFSRCFRKVEGRSPTDFRKDMFS